MKYFKIIFENHYKLFFVTLFFLFIMSLDGIGAPYFWGKFTDLMTSKDFFGSKKIILLWMLFLLIIATAQYCVKYFSGKLIKDINLNLRRRVSLQASSEENFNHAPAEYITTITSDIRQIEEKYVRSILTLILCFSQSVITFIFLMKINIMVGLLFALLGAIPSLIPKLTARWLKEGTEEWQITNKNYISFLEDFLDARRLIKRFNIKETIFQKLDKKLISNEDKYYAMELRQGGVNSLISILYVVALLGALLFGISSVKNGNISMGELITIYMAADRVISPLITVVTLYNVIQATEPILEKILPAKTSLQKDNLTFSSSLSKDEIIKFDEVSVGYKENLLIKDINYTIHSNEKILIKAESGTGKSTFIKTILGEIQPLNGKIEINKDIVDTSFSMSMVDQLPFIFDETIWFNLTFDQFFSKDEVITALNRVGLSKLGSDEMLSTKINRYSTVLSGEELKRIEFARSLLFNKKVLLVDEAFSGLDELHTKKLYTLIQEYPGTVIDVEHHIPQHMAEKYDRIITIKNKKILEIK